MNRWIIGMCVLGTLGCKGGRSEQQEHRSGLGSASALAVAPPPPPSDDMIKIEAGDFIARRTACEPGTMNVLVQGDDNVRGVAQRNDAFSIDRTVVTCSQYNACVEAKKCNAIDVACKFDVAVGPVSAAHAYCSWRSARLPSYAEWQRAARLTDGRPYPAGFETKSKCPPTAEGSRNRCAHTNEIGFAFAVENPNRAEWTREIDCVRFGGPGPADPRDVDHLAPLAVDLRFERLNERTGQVAAGEFRCAR